MGLFDFFKKNNNSAKKSEPIMYVIDAMNGNVIMVAEQVQWPVWQQLEKEALAAFQKEPAFSGLFEKFSTNAKKCKKSIHSSQSKPVVNIIDDPIIFLSLETGLSRSKLQALNGVRLFMYKVNYTLSPYGQPFPADCSLIYFFQGDI